MTNSDTAVDRVFKRSADCEPSTFRRDKYLAPHNIHELMRIDKMIKELPLQKKQPE